jgi:hypothetical protein
MSQMNEDQIKAALEADIITEKQAEAMRSLRRSAAANKGAANNEGAVIGNEDDMRFVRSFSDVFIAIGIGLFALGLGGVAGLLGGGTSYILAAGVTALMAAYFGKKKRQHLPTLITALAFLLFMHKGLGGLIGADGSGIMAAVLTLGAMLAYYVFIRLPFCIALIAISLIFLFFALAEQFTPGLLAGNRSWFFVIAGFATLAAAIGYDMRDLHRTTRFADNAFWLHFTAAPLIVHGLAFNAAAAKTELKFGLLPLPDVGSGDMVFLLGVVCALGVLALALNRRALLVSSLGYAGFAIIFLFSSSGVGFGTSIIFALLILGAAVMFLGTGWHAARNQLIKILPKWKIFPPPYIENFRP